MIVFRGGVGFVLFVYVMFGCLLSVRFYFRYWGIVISIIDINFCSYVVFTLMVWLDIKLDR